MKGASEYYDIQGEEYQSGWKSIAVANTLIAGEIILSLALPNDMCYIACAASDGIRRPMCNKFMAI